MQAICRGQRCGVGALSGIKQMGHAVAQRLNLCAIGRATNKRFLRFSAPQRLILEAGLAGEPVVV